MMHPSHDAKCPTWPCKHRKKIKHGTVKYGLRSKFSSGKDTALFSRSRDLIVEKSHESQVKVFMLSITIVSLGPSGVLKALQLEHKNWRTIVEPESRSRPAASLHGMNIGSCHEE